MKILFLLSIFAAHYAWSNELLFHPVTTINARTTQKGTLSLGRAPLGNLNSLFLTSSLNFALFSRLEVGTAPFYYVTPEHRFNYVAKLNFYRGKNFDWSAVYGQSVYRTKIELRNGETEKPDLEMSAFQLVTNFHPEGSRFAYGASFTSSCGRIDSQDVMIFLYSLECEDEYGLDLQYNTWPDQWITVGYGRMRESGITPYEISRGGVGMAYTWFLPERLISRPSVGFYKSKEDFMLLFTSTFSEKR